MGPIFSKVFSLGKQVKDIVYSAMFERNSSSLLRDSAQPTCTDERVWTLSVWVKRPSIGYTADALLSGYANTSNYDGVYFSITNNIRFYSVIGGLEVSYVQTVETFTDRTKWYHVVVAYDSTETTATDRMKIWVDGVAQTLTFTTGITLNTNTYTNNGTSLLSLGFAYLGANYYAKLLLSEFHFIDGQALTPADFGYNGPGSVWTPLTYTGTYGANGRYCDFSDNGASGANLGLDSSGNGNHFTDTVTGFGTDHQYTDTPTDNHANLVLTSLGYIYDGGVYTYRTSLAGHEGFYSQVDLKGHGKFYWEYYATTDVTPITQIAMGVCNAQKLARYATDTMTNISTDNGYLDWAGWTTFNDPSIVDDGSVTVTGDPSDPVAGEVIQVALDAINNKLWIGRDNDWYNSSGGITGDPAAGTNATCDLSTGFDAFYPCMVRVRGEAIANFGASGAFAYTPPSGFTAPSEKNFTA